MEKVSCQQGSTSGAGVVRRRRCRLRNQSQFEVMRASGQKVAGRTCAIVVLSTPPDGETRAAFLISRRFSLLAVERNRARRLLREVFARVKGRLEGKWILFIPRKAILKVSMWGVLEEVNGLLERFEHKEDQKLNEQKK